MYDKILKKMKIRIVILKITCIILAVIAAGAALPYEIDIGVVSVRREGIPLWVFILFIIALILFYTLAYAMIILPSENAMIAELDPQKYLALKTGLEPASVHPSDAYLTRMNSLYLMGDFVSAISYAEKIIGLRKSNVLVEAFFTKARAQFFLNDFDGMRETVMEFDSAVNGMKMSQKRQNVCENYRTYLNLMTAISHNDTENIVFFAKELKPWRKTEICYLQCDYLMGIAAAMTGDKRNAIYKLMRVKDKGAKTVFYRFADFFLEKID